MTSPAYPPEEHGARTAGTAYARRAHLAPARGTLYRVPPTCSAVSAPLASLRVALQNRPSPPPKDIVYSVNVCRRLATYHRAARKTAAA